MSNTGKDMVKVTSFWYYKNWRHKLFRIKTVNHVLLPMDYRHTPINRLNKWVIRDKNVQAPNKTSNIKVHKVG